MSDLSDYRAAYEAVIRAEKAGDAKGLPTAHERLRAAEEPLSARIDVLWDRNVVAVQAAEEAVEAAMRARLAVEVEVAASARARDPHRPVLNADEVVRARAAVAAVAEARTGYAAAVAGFKAGVTPDQMEADRALR